MNEQSSWDFEGVDTQYLTHNFHPFAARFIPQIPSKLIEDYSSPGERVLDPFMGCGTTLVECKLRARDGIGVDINPLFTIICRAKTTPLSTEKLEYLKSWQVALIQETRWLNRQTALLDSSIEKMTAQTPSWKNIDHWFTRNAQKELAVIKRKIDELNDQELRDFLLTCLSSIIVRVSYQDGETRYAKKVRPIPRLYVTSSFVQKLDDMVVRMHQFARVCSASKIETFSSDARNLSFLKDESCHLIVTSPPYMNAYDYHKYHRQRMLWLGIDPTPVRKAEIGGHDTFTKIGADPEAYFKDMHACLREMFRLLKPTRNCFIVMGDSIVNGKKIESQERLAAIGQETGFVNVDIMSRNIDISRKSFGCGARLEKEHIIWLRKP